jgi:hypothetical protein
VKLGVLFWFYKDAMLCENRLRLLRRLNPGIPVYGLYGGPIDEAEGFHRALGPLLDDFWAFDRDEDPSWKYRHGDMMLQAWFEERGRTLTWDSLFLAQWDLVVVTPLARLLPPMEDGDMLLSGLRPMREVEDWWHWTRGANGEEYRRFMAGIRASRGAVPEPMCCQFISAVLPRRFFECYGTVDHDELGFLEYKIPVYAQVFGIRLVPDPCFRPWWAEDPSMVGASRTDKLVHAWPTSVRLLLMLAEALRPGGRRAFHPYHGIYPHDLASVRELVVHRRTG